MTASLNLKVAIAAIVILISQEGVYSKLIQVSVATSYNQNFRVVVRLYAPITEDEPCECLRIVACPSI